MFNLELPSWSQVSSHRLGRIHHINVCPRDETVKHLEIAVFALTNLRPLQYLPCPFCHGAGQGPVEAASLGDEVGCAETFQPQKRMMIPKVIHIFHFLSECPDRSMSYDSFFCLGFVRFSADIQVFTGSNKQVQVPLVCHMFSGHLWPPHFCPSPCSLELLCETLENLFFFISFMLVG